MNKVKTNKLNILPLGDRVLVRPFSEEEARGEKGNKHFGIILPDAISKEKSAQGKVLAVGEGKYVDGKIVPMRVKEGDRVIFSKYSYDEVEHDGEDLYLLKEENLLAIIK
ncbi:MAG: co-chaperone GroES [bacterium]|nr:co-chaperone GroES [bacterium]